MFNTKIKISIFLKFVEYVSVGFFVKVMSGGINSETDALFDFLCSEIEGADNITYSIDATYKSPTPSGMSRAIQLGTPFYITIEGDAKLGGFWNLDLVNITVVARGSGVSEHYWK